jgi:hypothetical protein
VAHKEADETVEPPLPGPLLHKFVEEREKTPEFVLHEAAAPLLDIAKKRVDRGPVWGYPLCVIMKLSLQLLLNALLPSRAAVEV